jgi:hypothetical protein
MAKSLTIPLWVTTILHCADTSLPVDSNVTIEEPTDKP